MAKTVIRWQKKQPRQPYASFRNEMRKSEGVSEITSWLEVSTPENVLEDLRKYQEEWCNHVLEKIAELRAGGNVITTYRCIHCSDITRKSKAVSSG